MFRLGCFAVVSAVAACAANSPIESALNRMYNFDFAAADRILDRHMAEQPSDPLGPTFRAASALFAELDRLMILEGEFFADDKRIAEKKKLRADERMRDRFYADVEKARGIARGRLASRADDTDALFALCLTAGLVTDYVALIDKRQLGSLNHARESHGYAVRLLRLDPSFADAYLTTGLTEYLLGSVPFFLRWFLRFEEAQGDKMRAVNNLQRVIREGKYLGPFAKILLCIVHLREKRLVQCERLLTELVRDFPENPLLRKELTKVRNTALKR